MIKQTMCVEINTDQNWVLSTLVIGKGRQDTAFCKVDTNTRLLSSKQFQLAQFFINRFRVERYNCMHNVYSFAYVLLEKNNLYLTSNLLS